MSRAITVTVFALSFAALFVLPAASDVRPADAGKDLLTANTQWNGEIRQGAAVFPTTIYILERNKDRIRGEIDFKTIHGLNQLVFQGNVLEGRHVAWITDKKQGAVTFPGLYVGTLEGKDLSGVWQVPSAGQYDTFSVKLSD